MFTLRERSNPENVPRLSMTLPKSENTMDNALTSFLSGIAPTVASALLGPLGGVAVAGLTKILGIDGGTVADVSKAISNGNITPEHVAEIRKLELEYQNDEKERGFKYSELEFKDRDSARNREAQVKDNTNKILAYTVVGAFIAMVGATLLGYAKVESVLAGTLVGYLSAKCEQVLAYYFGSSAGSSEKSRLLANSAPVK